MAPPCAIASSSRGHWACIISRILGTGVVILMPAAPANHTSSISPPAPPDSFQRCMVLQSSSSSSAIAGMPSRSESLSSGSGRCTGLGSCMPPANAGRNLHHRLAYRWSRPFRPRFHRSAQPLRDKLRLTHREFTLHSLKRISSGRREYRGGGGRGRGRRRARGRLDWEGEC
jgi:hypothetical protein